MRGSYIMHNTCTHDRSEYWNIVVNLGSVSLGNALCNPHYVSALLFLQPHIGVEDPKVKLLHEGLHIDLHLQVHVVCMDIYIL